MPSATYTLIAKAMAERKQVLCDCGGFARAICPIVLGHTKGEERTLAYQFAGDSSGGLPRGGQWKCLDLSKMSGVQLRSGAWHDGTSHKRPQVCVEDVDLDVNQQSPYQPPRSSSRRRPRVQLSDSAKKS